MNAIIIKRELGRLSDHRDCVYIVLKGRTAMKGTMKTAVMTRLGYCEIQSRPIPDPGKDGKNLKGDLKGCSP